MEGIWTGLKNAAGLIGVAFTAGAVVNFAGKVFDAASEINTMSQRLGVSAETAQRLKYAMEQTGGSIEGAESAINFMNKALSDGDKSTVGALKAAGLEFHKIRTMKSEDAFYAIAEGVRGIKDPFIQADAAAKLFSKSAVEMMPAIKQGIKQLGEGATVMKDETVARLAAAADAWTAFWNKVTIISGEALGALMKATDFPAKIKQAAANAVKETGLSIDAQLKAVYSMSRAEQDAFVARYIARTGDILLASEKAGAALHVLTVEELKDRAEALKKKERFEIEHIEFFRKIDKQAAEDRLEVADALAKNILDNLVASNKARLASEQVLTQALAEEQKRRHDHAELLQKQALDAMKLAEKNYAEILKMREDAQTLAGQKGISSYDAQVFAIQRWAADTIAAFKGSEEQAEEFKKAVDALADAKTKAIPYQITEGWKQVAAALGVAQIGLNALAQTATGGQRQVIAALQSGIALFQAYAISAKTAADAASFAWGAATLGISIGVTALVSWWQGNKAAKEEARLLKAEVDELTAAILKFGQMPKISQVIDGAVAASQLPKLKAQLAELTGAQDQLNAAIQKYGFKIEELGPVWKQQRLTEQAQDLIKEFTILTASGIDWHLVLDKMGPALNEFLQMTIRAGGELPKSMEGMVKRLIEMGGLFDENGNKIEEIEGSGIRFSETMSEGFDRVITKLQELIETLTRGVGGAIKGLPLLPSWMTDGGSIFDAPHSGPGVPRAHAGALVTMAGLQKFHAGSARVLPFPRLQADEFPAILQSGEAVLNRRAVANVGRSEISAMNRGMSGGGGQVVQITNHITVNPSPGMDERALAEKTVKAFEHNTANILTTVRQKLRVG